MWPGEGNINENPLFVRNGVFDFDRFVTVEIGDSEYELPDFVVEQPDFHLEPGSPAIDAGTSAGAPSTDIEGNKRPCGENVDMGAYELCLPSETLFQRGDANADGMEDVSDAVFILLYLFAGQVEPSCLKSADGNDNGSVEIGDALYILNFLFVSGTPPPNPHPACAVDPTPDGLPCQRFWPCQ